MNSLTERLVQLPKNPGVYFHKNQAGEIIYVGKAANLSNRVRQYFHKSRLRDPKTDLLVSEIADIDWIVVETEIDALFLEAELIRRYRPHFNILLRDDKSTSYVRIDYNSQHPTVSLTRRPLDDGGRYFGPYFSNIGLRRALKYLRRAFPYSTHARAIPPRACLQYHLGLCPGLEEGKTSLSDYRRSLRQLILYLKGQRPRLVKQIEAQMKQAASAAQFEQAALLRNRLRALQGLSQQIIFSDREFMNISKDHGLVGLMEILGLPAAPRRIEGFDISHMQGSHNTASMVVFSGGLPDKAAYRKFKLRRPGNDDYAHIHEALSRRLRPTNRQAWGLPDLLLIDGGKGQLTAAIQARDEQGLDLPVIGLAKRQETIIVHKQKSRVTVDRPRLIKDRAMIQDSADFISISLPANSHVIKLLQRIRDESHRFAVSYHSVLKTKHQTASRLDDIPGIGPASRKKLLKEFGSLKAIMAAPPSALSRVVGASKAEVLSQYLAGLRPE